MYRQNLLSGLICSLLLFNACGRKQRSLFQFPEAGPVKISKLALPSVKGVSIRASAHDVYLMWQSITVQAPTQLLGYHVYRLPRGRFVEPTPLTKTILVDSEYCDKNALSTGNRHSYMVRAVFKVHDQVIYGLGSKIVSLPFCDR